MRKGNIAKNLSIPSEVAEHIASNPFLDNEGVSSFFVDTYQEKYMTKEVLIEKRAKALKEANWCDEQIKLLEIDDAIPLNDMQILWIKQDAIPRILRAPFGKQREQRIKAICTEFNTKYKTVFSYYRFERNINAILKKEGDDAING